MQVEAKVVVTAAAVVLLAVVVLAVDRGDRGGANADRAWRGGRNDLVRRLMLRPDGQFNRYTKHTIAALFAMALAAMWTLL
jgi:hypothetical protein